MPDELLPIDAAEASALRKARRHPLREIESDELEQLQHDLRSAGEVQSNLLPQRVPKLSGYDFDAYYSSSWPTRRGRASPARS
jgi:serine phosphatase RsbU (regulator of sigma subunit)